MITFTRAATRLARPGPSGSGDDDRGVWMTGWSHTRSWSRSWCWCCLRVVCLDHDFSSTTFYSTKSSQGLCSICLSYQTQLHPFSRLSCLPPVLYHPWPSSNHIPQLPKQRKLWILTQHHVLSPALITTESELDDHWNSTSFESRSLAEKLYSPKVVSQIHHYNNLCS